MNVILPVYELRMSHVEHCDWQVLAAWPTYRVHAFYLEVLSRTRASTVQLRKLPDTPAKGCGQGHVCNEGGGGCSASTTQYVVHVMNQLDVAYPVGYQKGKRSYNLTGHRAASHSCPLVNKGWLTFDQGKLTSYVGFLVLSCLLSLENFAPGPGASELLFFPKLQKTRWHQCLGTI